MTSGPAASPEPEREPAVAEDWPSSAAVRVASVFKQLEAGEAWRGIDFQATGNASSWLIGYQPYAELVTEHGYSFKVTIKASAPPSDSLRLLLVPGSPLELDSHAAGGDGKGVLYRDHVEAITAAPGETVEHTFNEGGSGLGSDAFAGVLFAVASNGKWELDVNYTNNQDAGNGTIGVPSFLKAGNGTVTDVATSLTTQAGPVEFTRRLDAPGWNHVQVIGETALEDDTATLGIQQYDVDFPSGFQQSGTEPSGQVNTELSYFGVFHDTAGRVAASFTPADDRMNQQLVFFHIPIPSSDLPESLTGYGYCQNHCEDPLLPMT